MAKIKSQGTTLHISNEDVDATAYATATFVKVAGIRSIGNPDGESAEIDTTDLDSVATEFMIGLPDNGKFSISGQAVAADPGQGELLAARDGQELRWIKITDSAAKVAYFKGAVTKFADLGAEVNGVKPVEGSIRISGGITRVA